MNDVGGGFVTQALYFINVRNLKLIKISGEFDFIVFDQFLDSFGGDALDV